MNRHRKLPYLLLCLIIFGGIQAIHVDAVDDDPPLQKARQLVEEGSYGEALIVFSKILESEGSSQVKAEAAAQAGEVLTGLGQFNEAVNQFEVANSFLKASDTPKGFRGEIQGMYAYRLANAYALAEKWDEAKAAFEAFIEGEGRVGSPSQPDFGQLDERVRSAQRKVEWIDRRIFSQSKLTFHFVASLFAFLLTTALCLYIFAKDPFSYLNISLSLFMFGFALWQLADAVRSFTLNPETARFWGNVLIGGIGLVCIANLNFILVFIQRRKDENFETLRWFFVILPPMTLITLVPTNLYTQGADLFYWGREAEIHGRVHKLFFLYIALYVIYGITMITRANLTISKGAAAKPITYMFFTLSFIFFPSLVAVILVPLSKYSHYVIGASSLTVIAMAGGLIYSIRRHHLIDVDAVLSKSLVYFVLTGLLIGGYVLLVNLFSELSRGLFGIQTSFWAYVAATFIVSILFQTTRNRIQSLLDRLFHKERSLYQQTLLDFSGAVTTILDLDRLCHLLVDTVTNAMGIDKGWLWIEKENGTGYEVAAAIGQDNTIVGARHTSPLQDSRSAISIPLQQDEHLIGVLSLGRKYSGKPFTKSDREMLSILANQAAVAITNAKLVNQLRRADQLTTLGRLAAGIAHEVRNPLLAIKGAAQFLEAQSAKEGEAREFANIIVEESDRINQLITQFLDYARPAKTRLQPIDITECLSKTLALLRVELRHAKVEWVRDYAPDLLRVWGDEKQLGQLFLNLLLNAIEAMRKGGTLRVSTLQQAERCEIQISDTGIGMSKEEQARIFEPFYTGKEHGLGLGLAIVGEIVSQHGGTISVESVKGKGTTFTVGLQVSNGPSAIDTE